MSETRLGHFFQDEAGTNSAEYTIMALIVFVLLILMLIPVGDRLEFLWRRLLDLLRILLDSAPAIPDAGQPQ